MFNKYHAMALAMVLATYSMVALYPALDALAVADFALLCKGVVVATMLLYVAVAERKRKQALAQ